MAMKHVSGQGLYSPFAYMNASQLAIHLENQKATWTNERDRYEEECYQRWLKTGKGNKVGYEERRDAQLKIQKLTLFLSEKKNVEDAFDVAVKNQLLTKIEFSVIGRGLMHETKNELSRLGYIENSKLVGNSINISIEPNMYFSSKNIFPPTTDFVLLLPDVQIFIDRINKKKQDEENVRQIEIKRLAEIAEKKRLADEVERKRLAEIAEKKRLADEVERKRLAEIAEKKRLADEEERKQLFEIVEKKRLADEEERKRLEDEKKIADAIEQKKKEYEKMIKERMASNLLFSGFDFSFE